MVEKFVPGSYCSLLNPGNNYQFYDFFLFPRAAYTEALKLCPQAPESYGSD